MTQEEQAFVKLQIENTINNALKPIVLEAARQRQTLYGPNNDGGLVKDVEDLNAWQATIDKERQKMFGIALGVSAVSTVIINVAVYLITNFLAK